MGVSVDICIIIPPRLLNFFIYFFPNQQQENASDFYTGDKNISSILFMLSDEIERGEAKGNVQFHRLACLCISASFFFPRFSSSRIAAV